MKLFVLIKSAERDLDQIKSFLIEKAGPTVTRRVLRDIRSALKLLGNEPGAGHVRED
jgi:plasmid stabilization system protein ParE